MIYAISKTSAVALILLLGIATYAEATHPYHVSLAEIEFNQTTGNFEVALCVWPADLEKALSRQLGRPVDLDTIEDLDEKLAQYVSSCFQINNAKGEEAKIRWVGHEKDLKKAWLYFEVQTKQASSKWTLENRVFFELNEDQTNQVNLRIGSKRSSSVHTLNAAIHPLR